MKNGKRIEVSITLTGEGTRQPRDIFMEFIHKLEVAGYKVEAMDYNMVSVKVNEEGELYGA